MALVVVLSDGETWTTIEGCVVMDVTDEQLDFMQIEDVKPRDLEAPSVPVTRLYSYLNGSYFDSMCPEGSCGACPNNDGSC